MPRTSRASRGGFVYHVLNRGNGRSAVFHNEEDFAAFAGLMREANDKVPMRVTGYCLMANHFHLLLWPKKDGDLSRWMQWLLTSHVRRYHRLYQGSGHVWEGRFKAFPVQSDNHYLTVLRYIEGNPLRANLVQRNQEWEWSSLKPTAAADPAGLLYRWAGAKTNPMDPPGERRPKRGGTQSLAAQPGQGHPVWRPHLASKIRQKPWPGVFPSTKRPPQEGTID